MVLPAVGRLDVGGEDELVGQLAGLGILDDEALLVVADGGADHLFGDREIFCFERSHHDDRPFDETGHFVQQHLIFDELEPLRECQLLGVRKDDILARLRIEDDFCSLQLGLIVLEPAHAHRVRRHEAMTVGGLAGLNAVHREFDDIGLFGLGPERRGDRVQRAHPAQRSRFSPSARPSASISARGRCG
ncbi:hypothetical protein ACVWW4_003193 [Bradyrhizobium sp. LB7.1]